MQSVNVVDVLFALVDFALNPMAVEVAKKMMDVFGGNRVAVPFLDVVGQQTLVSVLLRFLV